MGSIDSAGLHRKLPYSTNDFMPAAILARSILLEARRGGLPWLAAASIVAGLALAAFLSQVALTDSLALQAGILARSILLGARRGGLPWLAAASIVAGLALAAFLSQVALTESLALQAAIL